MSSKKTQVSALSEDLQDETILNEVLENAPPEHRKKIEQMMISSIQMRAELSPETEVMKKLTSAHITSFLAASKEEMEKSYQDRNRQRIFSVIMVGLAMLFVIILVLLLKDHPDVMEKVIYASGGLVAGAIGGYGFGKNKSSN